MQLHQTRGRLASLALPCLLVASSLVGCEACEDLFDGGGDPPPVIGGVGDPCEDGADCRAGLICAADLTCQPSGTGIAGSACQLTGDCGAGLYCGASRTCAAAGEGEDGADCGTTADCVPGLVCALEGFGGRCRGTGSLDLGDDCASDRECLAGLSCVADALGASRCASPNPIAGDGGVGLPPSLPFWAGETCLPAEGAPRAFFDVPRGAGADGDFYRLPFPNDARRTTDGLDLSRHPTPATALPIDVVGRVLRASEEDLDGFATNPVVFFRFSTPYDWASVEGAFRLVDVTPGSPDYGMPVLASWLTTSGPISRYICENWFAIRPPPGLPLRPGTTYAAILDTAIRPAPDAGASYERSPDLDAMLAGSAPSDAALAGAWEAYAPLRAWLADSGGAPSSILNATVFTTQTVDDAIPNVRAVIRARPAPTVQDLVVCDAGVASPCDDGTEERACGAMDPDFFEVHGRIALPIFQHGTPPYEAPEDGGGLVTDGSGTPTVARTEDVCFALTVPRGAAPPAEGFPLLVFGHGTGGSFTSFVRSGLAGEVSNAMVGGAPLRAATLSIDLPQHGERRGGSTRAPEFLFFNFANPRAARDNITQGAADLLSLVFFGETYAADAATFPTAQAIRFDPARIVLYTHSQGSTHASLMVHHEPGVRAIVLSGNGGHLTESMLHKTQPIDIAGALPFALLDPTREGQLATGAFHPALALIQAYFERVDPVNHARRLAREPLPGAGGRHVFMTYGPGDTYSPEETMRAYSVAAGFTHVRPVLGPPWRLLEADAPLVANARVDGTAYTFGLRQYTPNAGEDGHFVAFRTTTGLGDTRRFARMALAGLDPEIGALP